MLFYYYCHWLTYVDESFYCDSQKQFSNFCRNTIFNYKGRASLKEYLTFYIYNAWYYLIIKHKWSWFYCFNKAFFSGFKKIPNDGYRKYMK